MGNGKGKAGTLRSAALRIGPFCSFSLGGDETASARGQEVSGQPGSSSRGQRNERAIANQLSILCYTDQTRWQDLINFFTFIYVSGL